jgi:hypothetical protein
VPAASRARASADPPTRGAEPRREVRRLSKNPGRLRIQREAAESLQGLFHGGAGTSHLVCIPCQMERPSVKMDLASRCMENPADPMEAFAASVERSRALGNSWQGSRNARRLSRNVPRPSRKCSAAVPEMLSGLSGNFRAFPERSFRSRERSTALRECSAAAAERSAASAESSARLWSIPPPLLSVPGRFSSLPRTPRSVPRHPLSVPAEQRTTPASESRLPS